jgi:hypothetical protein
LIGKSSSVAERQLQPRPSPGFSFDIFDGFDGVGRAVDHFGQSVV